MKIIHRMFSAVAWLVSKMPDWMLYFVSLKLYFLLSYLLAYRKNVVKENLTKCFPHYDNKQIHLISKSFYKHLCDVIVEVIKTPGLSREQIKSRYHFKNPEVLNALQSKNKSTIIVTGHLGNWEWMGPGMLLNFPGLDGYVVVKPLSDPFFDDYLNNMRMLQKSDVIIPFKQTLRYMIRNKDKTTFTLFAADQTPHRDELKFSAQFLNRPTPFFTGFEKIAKALDQAVIFMDMYRVRRGYYEAVFYPITENPGQTADYEITNAFVRLLEEAIERRPENWMWSHRRWKYAESAGSETKTDIA
ncbi:MAG: lysophospholipid acyltransferase family protein [Bacteroidales bacterium]|nr:lysophospholipid acyltransferase family protein [Bacteroidales bacterium]MDZ4205102.1 lysophospholipid acyltransferase family protein [Bacteroidales bacterium]